MVRRWLAGVAAVLGVVAVVSVTRPASADVAGRWFSNCATGATTSATVSGGGQIITMTGTITPCIVPPFANSYGWIVYGQVGEAVLYQYLGDETLRPVFAYRVAYGSTAVCLAYSPAQSGRLGCFGVDIGADGTVTAPSIPTNDPRVLGRVVVVRPVNNIEPQPNCATCVDVQ